MLTTLLSFNIIIGIMGEFCSDFNIKHCNQKIYEMPSEYMPTVDDPKGKRKAHGVCHLYSFSSFVSINKDHWDSIGKYERKELIYHELGHCMLYMQHNNDTSIMNPFPNKGQYHVKSDGSNWQHLVNEMKNRTTK